VTDQPPTRTEAQGAYRACPTFPEIAEDARRLRAGSVDGYVTRRINHREGDVTGNEIDRWTEQGGRRWDRENPALSALLGYLDRIPEVSQ
jgi:hypothetical protein